MVRERREAIARAKERLYPSIPIKSTPRSLPLDKCPGSHSHPSYGDMNFVVDGAGLVANRTENEIAMNVELKHVSGEFWLAFLKVLHRDERDIEVVRAEFHISADGEVDKFGAELEPRMGSEKIWFIRTRA